MITLIFLIVEVRRNTRASLDDSMQKSFERFSHVRSMVATNPQLAAIVEKALTDDELTASEARQVENYLSEFGFVVLYYMDSLEVSSETESQVLDESSFEYYVSLLDNNFGRRLVLAGMPFPQSFTDRLAERLIKTDDA